MYWINFFIIQQKLWPRSNDVYIFGTFKLLYQTI